MKSKVLVLILSHHMNTLRRLKTDNLSKVKTMLRKLAK